MKPMTEEMVCKELVELVTEYLEGALSPVDRARFEEHLGACAKCRTFVAQLQETTVLVGAALTEDALDREPELRDELLLAFRDWKLAR